MVVAVVVARHSLLPVFVSAMVADLAAVVVEQQTLFAATESDARQA